MDNSAEPDGAWPAWATEVVTLEAPDPRYPVLARSYTDELADLLAGAAADDVEHVGSTAVAGLVAKPVVDLTVTLTDPGAWCTANADELVARAWHLVPPELDVDRERRLLVRVDPAGTHRLAHLHALWPGSERRGALIAFRDALSADAWLAAEYAELKRAAAAAHHADREAYTASKASFVARVLATG